MAGLLFRKFLASFSAEAQLSLEKTFATGPHEDSLTIYNEAVICLLCRMRLMTLFHKRSISCSPIRKLQEHLSLCTSSCYTPRYYAAGLSTKK